MGRFRGWTLALAAICGGALGVRCYASDSVNIYQMAVTGVPIPSLGVTFTSFSAPTAGDRDTDGDTGLDAYLFIASTSNGSSGVYTYDAHYNDFFDVADTTMAAPTGGNFASFSNLSSGLGAVGFVATDTNGVQGVYGIGNIPLTLIATSGTSTSTGGTLGNTQAISVSGDPYGNPSGTVLSDTGIYSFLAGSPAPVLDDFNYDGLLSSVGPISYKGSVGTSNVPGFHELAFAWVATLNGTRSVFFDGPTAANKAVASLGSSIPNNTGTFTSFSNPIITTNEVSFTAHYTTNSGDQQGIFVYGPYQTTSNFPHLYQIVSTGQVAPTSNGATFTGFSDLSDSSFDQTFIATLSNGGEGLFVNVNEAETYSPAPQLLKVVETGDSINGKTVLGFELSPDASNYYDVATLPYGNDTNNGIGFEVSFTDGSEGLYYFTVNLPEPGAFCLCGVPLMILRRRR